METDIVPRTHASEYEASTGGRQQLTGAEGVAGIGKNIEVLDRPLLTAIEGLFGALEPFPPRAQFCDWRGEPDYFPQRAAELQPGFPEIHVNWFTLKSLGGRILCCPAGARLAGCS